MPAPLGDGSRGRSAPIRDNIKTGETPLNRATSSRTPARTAGGQVIVALDFPDSASALRLVGSLGNLIQWYKVGLELYLSAGNEIVRNLKDKGFSVFLDLKLHDIPNTVAGAVRSAASTGADMLTLHASGGPAMLAAAARAAAGLSSPPRLLAVSVLTSMDADQLHAIGIAGSPAEQVVRLASLAAQAGISGLVASPEEIVQLRSAFPDFTLVIPGIRPAGSAAVDQKRVATPGAAIAAGADYLVIGRPITQAADPVGAAKSILDEIALVAVPG
jgi:orotidine-5'-phosphate decarboxylase